LAKAGPWARRGGGRWEGLRNRLEKKQHKGKREGRKKERDVSNKKNSVRNKNERNRRGWTTTKEVNSTQGSLTSSRGRRMGVTGNVTHNWGAWRTSRGGGKK